MEFAEIKKIRNQCLKHANKLVEASKLMIEKKLPNIAYHLSTLALEEIGKSVMLVVGHDTTLGSQKGIKLLRQAAEDHSKKLFWALWGPTFGKKDMSGQQIQSFVGLSKRIHFLRMKGLYVDPYQVSLPPSKSISIRETKSLISITEARLKMEQYTKIREPKGDVKSDFIWFHNAVDDSEKRKLIFGNKSINKLKEFNGDARAWINWMHEQFDKAEKESKEMLQMELSQIEPPDSEKVQQKWKVRFRIKTLSHSIRNKCLNSWNKRTEHIRLFLGDKKPRPELIVEMILPKGVPLKALWYAAWGEARRLAVSLSIASKGYFWWYLPKDVAKFYEKIIDLESNTEVGVERSPKLELNWGRDVLSEADLINTIMCYRFLPRDNINFLNDYVTGLSFFGKNDIHTPFEKEIYLDFYHALLHAMIFYKDHGNGDPFIKSFERVFSNLLKDTAGVKEYIEIAEELIIQRKARKNITLSECGAMKILCDVYLHHKVDKMAQEELKNKDVS